VANRLLFGAIEGGGTKFLCGVGYGPNDFVDQCEFLTTTPHETLGRAATFFRSSSGGRVPDAIGVASFGPIDADPMSPSYGCITTTPKLEWQHTDVVGMLSSEFGVPIGWDTDVNAAALGEWQWGAGRGVDPVLYVTVGTGIGGGAVVNGRTLHGLVHPEMGHLPLPVVPEDSFPGICPFHQRCLEGMASGPAIEARLGRRGELISAEDPIWEVEAIYLALGLLSMVYILSPQRIVLAGGVMSTPGLIDRVRRHLVAINHDYVATPFMAGDIDALVVPPALGRRAGLVGALELAVRAHAAGTSRT
jgi:fructokinase